MEIGEEVELGDGFFVTRITPTTKRCQETGCTAFAEYVVFQDVDYVTEEFHCCEAHIPYDKP